MLCKSCRRFVLAGLLAADIGTTATIFITAITTAGICIVLVMTERAL